MEKSFHPSNLEYKKTDDLIKESFKKDKYSLSTIFDLISGMDGPRALQRIEEVIISEKNSFKDLEVVFKSIEKSWLGHYDELRRRALISFFKRPDCPKSFIDKYGLEVFPGTKKSKSKS